MSVIDSGREVIERPFGGAAAAVIVIAALVALRAIYGVFVGNSINPITYYGLIGGVLGALAMIGALRLLEIEGYPPSVDVWAEYIGGGTYRQAIQPGMALHVIYGAVMGALYPRLAWMALGGNAWASITGGVFWGIAFSLFLFMLASVMNTFGLFDMNRRPDQAIIFLGMHVVYGAVLGLTTGVLFALL